MSTALLEELRSEDPAARARACRQAASDPAGALFAEGLVEALADPEPGVVRAASDALEALERRGAGVRAAVKRALAGPGRPAAALLLARLGPPDVVLLPPLVEALASPTRDVAWAAARALVGVGRAHAEVLPVLLGLVENDERLGVRRMAVLALGELARGHPESIAALLTGTRDPAAVVRGAAASALGGQPAAPAEVAARLAELVEGDPDLGVRRRACAALAQVGDALPGPSRQALERAGRDPELEQAASFALAQWTQRGKRRR